MIPAIGTCVFVVYLYFKLKGEEDSTDPTSVRSPADVQSADALTARMASLETRLERLARKQEKPS